MRSLAAVLSLAALAATRAAVAPCPSAGSGALGHITLTPDGEWGCAEWSFGAGGASRAIAFDWPLGWQGYKLQLFAWNYEQTKNDAANPGWTTFGVPMDVVWQTPAADNRNPLDTNNAANYNSGFFQNGGVVSADWKEGSDIVSGAYGWGGETDASCPGTGWIIGHGDVNATAVPGGAKAHVEVKMQLLYRVIPVGARPMTARTALPASAGVSPDSSLLPSLQTGKPVTLTEAVLPGGSLSFEADVDAIKYGHSVHAMQLSVGTDHAGLVKNETSWDITLPDGYSAPGPMHMPEWAEAQGYVGVTLTGSSGATETIQTQWKRTAKYESEGKMFTRTWTGMVDANSIASSTGIITVTAGEITGTQTETYDWTRQSSPFWTVIAAIDVVEEYPMLGMDTAIELKHEANQLSSLDDAVPAFKTYIVKASTTTYRMRLKFDGVKHVFKWNTNQNDGQNSPANDPLWEVVQTYDGSDMQRLNNGQRSAWISQDNTAAFYKFPVSNGQTNVAATWFVDSSWWSSNTKLPVSSATGVDATTAVGDEVWLPDSQKVPNHYLVRVAASSSLRGAGCSVEAITISKLSVEKSDVIDECTSYMDCTVDAKGHPAESRAKESAMKDAQRFSTCRFIPSYLAGGIIVPTTQCVECTDDSHCGGGMYCSLVTGTCSLAGTAQYYYNCDADATAHAGTCMTKSPKVLGQYCTNADAGHAVEGDGGKAFSAGSHGVCGEYAYYNASSTMEGRKRAAYWEGTCVAHKCLECEPAPYGATQDAPTGQVCLNGRLHKTLTVDGTVRTFAQNTLAGNQLGTTTMLIVLVSLFAAYIFAEMNRFKLQQSGEPLTCCEMLCCCGACTFRQNLGGKNVMNPVRA